MTWAFEFAGMASHYDAEGLMGRGLYVGRHDPEFSSGVARAGRDISQCQARGLLMHESFAQGFRASKLRGRDPITDGFS
jgi:hypothetical protein